jgi:hypothetical protein
VGLSTYRPSGLSPVATNAVVVGVATVVAGWLVLDVGAAAGRRAVVDGRAPALAVVEVGLATVVEVDDVVVVEEVDDVVSGGVVVEAGSASVAPASSVRRMAGSVLRWGTPAMATPIPAHTTSMSTVTDRCPGLTAGPSRPRR